MTKTLTAALALLALGGCGDLPLETSPVAKVEEKRNPLYDIYSRTQKPIPITQAEKDRVKEICAEKDEATRARLIADYKRERDLSVLTCTYPNVTKENNND